MPGPAPRTSGLPLTAFLQAHQAGLLFVVAVGGGAEVQAVMAEADREARNQDHLGVYQLTDDGGWFAWRTAPCPLESAAAADRPSPGPDPG